MFDAPVSRPSQPDFVQSGPLSHTFGQPFSRPVRTIARIRSLWPFPAASVDSPDSTLEHDESRRDADRDDPTPSSFIT